MAGVAWAGLIGKIAGGVAGTVKGIAGAIQYRRGNRAMNRLLANRPVYDISEGYQNAYDTYRRLAASEMPGYNLMQDQIGQATARANTAAERGAMSSNQYLDATLNAQDKELEAIKNLGLMSAQWKTQQQQNLAQAQNQMGQLQDTQWDYNVNQKWGMNMNMASEMRQMGAQNWFAGLGDIAGSAQQYAGTSYYNNMLAELRKQQQQQPPVQNTGNGYTYNNQYVGE